eukprot:MONOS_9395.1-p1 / transcript=MONOS_9395.1 / gene=MONOS_9395 / organism=Monocercomonoides_exilis_PA203 / gene_product=1,4-alpha-glucan branching enzyme / transcript_product=1,4-alpha-glucan branching enzyme / location=Mono_scaffold00387:4141-6597(-) / protein_length=564 / sequence_SO=supercontig / SO=protein_coding / is_pseudo=false
MKTIIFLKNGKQLHRISPWSRITTQDGIAPLDARLWNPEVSLSSVFTHDSPRKPDTLRIYEVHIGMSSEEKKITTWNEGAKIIIPHAKAMGYNAIELMGVAEHAYYPSFGYQVTSYFSPSGRFGTPFELASFIDQCHAEGLLVLMDVVHAHASSNSEDGLNSFDGSDTYFFHSGERGIHKLWKTRVFDYGVWETKRFLLSNLRFWVEEFHFDGFRFDGVGSMLYKHHGINKIYTSCDDYFDSSADEDAITYLKLANDMLHTLKSDIITIAEDVSGMPGLCRPVSEGGIGFDYRFSMGIPDLLEILVLLKDEDWNMDSLWNVMTDRRYSEKTIAYCECHDQALQGKCTLSQKLMGDELETSMSCLREETININRGIALHKMIRLITFALGGEGTLTFMGNEFGHPKWIDFPRKENGWSFEHCRRRWSLMEDEGLRFKYLMHFERRMIEVDEQFHWMTEPHFSQAKHDNTQKIIAFERKGLVFLFNFHPTASYADFKVGVRQPGKYKIVLNTDSKEFGGGGRIEEDSEYFSSPISWDGHYHSIQVYIPSRVALVLHMVDSVEKKE